MNESEDHQYTAHLLDKEDWKSLFQQSLAERKAFIEAVMKESERIGNCVAELKKERDVWRLRCEAALDNVTGLMAAVERQAEQIARLRESLERCYQFLEVHSDDYLAARAILKETESP